jgi:hypothetical protein
VLLYIKRQKKTFYNIKKRLQLFIKRTLVIISDNRKS